MQMNVLSLWLFIYLLDKPRKNKWVLGFYLSTDGQYLDSKSLQVKWLLTVRLWELKAMLELERCGGVGGNSRPHLHVGWILRRHINV